MEACINYVCERYIKLIHKAMYWLPVLLKLKPNSMEVVTWGKKKVSRPNPNNHRATVPILAYKILLFSKMIWTTRKQVYRS